jgi:hypothetical protein
MRYLFVITGESFRLGLERPIRGRSTSAEATNQQKLATYSHLRLINHLNKTFNATADIFINSYKLNSTHDAMLLEWYKPYNIIYSNFYDALFPSEDLQIVATNKLIYDLDLSVYDFVLFVRIDIYIKKYFLTRFISLPDSLCYAHLCYNGHGLSQQIMFVPKRYFEYINAPIDLNFRCMHWGYEKIRNHVPDISFDYFINSYHSLSTDDNWNPIYTQVGRPENFTRTHHFDRCLCKDKLCIHLNHDGYGWTGRCQTIDDDTEYELLLHTDTLEENLKLLEADKFDIGLN